MSRGHFSRDSNALDLNKSADTSYERYKANLHAIFDGRAPLPNGIRELAGVEPAPATEATKDEVVEVVSAPTKSLRRKSPAQGPYSLFTQALQKASTHDEMQHAVAAFKEAKHAFPSDEDLLSKVLTHPSEEIVLEVLGQLEELFAAHPPKNPRLLASRLEDAAFLSKPGAAKDRILGMKAKYRA